MTDWVNITIAFGTGAATVIGTYVAFRQFRNSLPSIMLVHANGSGLLSPEEEDEGYTWVFRLAFQNRKNIEYAIKDILWAPATRSLRRKIPAHTDGWQHLIFKDALDRPSGSDRIPLIFKPYEYKELRGCWSNYWVDDPRDESSKDYWRDNPEDEALFHNVLEHLHNRRVIFRVDFVDGKSIVFKKI